jgi:predicted ATPase/class 3 adenylate cyclase
MAGLPTGTVTFLFTDIEGSTRLWEKHPEAMKVALARHDQLLRGAIEAHRGNVFKTIGDAFCAAFWEAEDAVAATLQFQRALAAEPWGDTGPLKVRAALNTGETQERDGDYFGPALNRVARLLSAGYGGQILLCGSTAGVVRGALPDGASLRDLGERRLKDLTHPEHVYQLYAADLPADFPPLKTLDSRPNNLPAQTTLFIGREKELEAIRQRLLRPEVRVLTLMGPGGVGKTRLGLQAAADMLSYFEDGLFFVSLSALRDPALVIPTVAQALGIKESGGQPLLETLKEELRSKQLLLMLDNLEQVADAALQLSELLAACPKLKLLVTSRVPLRVRGENKFEVPSMSLPERGQRLPVEELRRYEAVRLFAERAQEVEWEFALTAENGTTVVEICRRLDGLPLAIELAAARIDLFPPGVMLSRLEQRLKLLTDGAVDLPERQQTMRGAIAWSYDLLTPAEQALFRHLSVFSGGFTLEAAGEVCAGAGEPAVDVPSGIQSLAAKSLLRPAHAGDEARFLMLETIREYGAESLSDAEEAAAVQPRHARFFVTMAEAADPELTGPRQGEWMARLERDHDNLREAMRWSLGNAETEVGARIAGAIWRFWAKRGHLSEGRDWLERLLSASGAGASAVRATACRGAGNLAWRQGDYASAWRYHEESLDIHRSLGDRHGMIRDLVNLGNVAVLRGDYPLAQSLNEEALAISREVGDKWHVALVLNNLGVAAHEQGDYQSARSLYEESLAICREMNDRGSVAVALFNLAEISLYLEDCAPARALCEESLAMYRELGDTRGIAQSLQVLGRVALLEGNTESARSYAAETLSIYREVGDQRGGAEALELSGGIAAAEGQAERAARLLGAAEAIRQAIQCSIPPAILAGHERTVASVRAALGEERFAAVWTEGRSMGFEKAVDFALAGGISVAAPPARVTLPSLQP